MEFIVAAYAIAILSLVGYAASVRRRTQRETRGR